MGEKKSIMDKIAESSRFFTTGIDDKDIEHWVTIHIMGRAYKVPAGLTLMQAMEYAGYRFITSCGCRGGFCGACATIYRNVGDYKLYAALACQTRVEDGMYLVQIPFVPAEKANYDIGEEDYDYTTIVKYYPEIARCVACNTCTKACPQDLEVMDYIQAILRGDFEKAAEGSFECIHCGMCAMRCPAGIVQYHIGQLVRRLYGRNAFKSPESLKKRVEEIKNEIYEKDFEELLCASTEELKKLYTERKRESG